MVASFMGAWIETTAAVSARAVFCVASFMGAWIETDPGRTVKDQQTVASFMGAWIETQEFQPPFMSFSVASFMGAWIETVKRNSFDWSHESHPLWVRGLKRQSESYEYGKYGRILYGCVD